jgi:glycogen synthase
MILVVRTTNGTIPSLENCILNGIDTQLWNPSDKLLNMTSVILN